MTNSIKKNPNEKNRGQIIIILALAMIGLLAAIGLAIDAVVLYTAKQTFQRSLDAAVLAGSRKLPDQTVAEEAVYEMMRLYGYDFDPASNPLTISFPTYSPPRKVIGVEGTIKTEFFFLPIVGWESVDLTVSGEAESAPLDVYLILDNSASMTYDTVAPSSCHCSGDPGSNSCIVCRARYCNNNNNCDPLDTKVVVAAKYFIDLLSSDYDRVGVVIYDWDGAHVISLTDDFDAVKTALEDIDAYEDTGYCTNVGDGIMVAHDYLADEGRSDSIWSMVLLTDGKANLYRSCTGCPPNCSGSSCSVREDTEAAGTRSVRWAVDNASDTWNRHETVIYTIAYGDEFTKNPDYKDLLITIADITDNGIEDGITENFWEAPDESELRVALEEIAARIFTRLLR